MSEDYWKFAESERHFNEIQAGIRHHAATWMLAAFAAIAILLKSEKEVSWLISPAVLVGVVSLMAALGLLVLWINDQLVYERLLDCGFIIALKMEHDNPQLPPVRSMMMCSAKGKGMSRLMVWFYLIPMVSFLLTSIAVAILRTSLGTTDQGMSADQSLMVLIPLCVVQFAVTLWVGWNGTHVGAKAVASRIGAKNLAAMFEGTAKARHARFAKVIERYRPAQAAEGGSDK